LVRELEAGVHDELVVLVSHIRFGKRQFPKKIKEVLRGEAGGEALGRGGIALTPRLRGVKVNRHICSHLQTRDDDLGCSSCQWGWKTEHSDHLEISTPRCSRCIAPNGGSMHPCPTASYALS